MQVGRKPFFSSWRGFHIGQYPERMQQDGELATARLRRGWAGSRLRSKTANHGLVTGGEALGGNHSSSPSSSMRDDYRFKVYMSLRWPWWCWWSRPLDTEVTNLLCSKRRSALIRRRVAGIALLLLNMTTECTALAAVPSLRIECDCSPGQKRCNRSRHSEPRCSGISRPKVLQRP